MKQPEFTIWPWKVAALAVPTMAMAAVLLAASQAADTRECTVVFFSVLAAGNAYVFAMAVGDFGRSVIAIPVGAVAGVVAVEVFKFQGANVLYLLFLGILVIVGMARGFMRALPGCGLLILVFWAFLLAAAAGGRRGNDVTLSGLSAYPFVCGAVTASMPLENNLPGIWNAGMAGTRAALHGLLMGALFALLGLPLALVVFTVLLLPGGRAVASDVAVLVPAITALLATNYYCVRHVFAAVHRVEAPSAQASSEPPGPLAHARGSEAPPAASLPASQAEGRYGMPADAAPLPKITLPDETSPEQEKES